MKATHISDIWNLQKKGHENFEFVDVNVNKDNLLFIDPSLIERSDNKWGLRAQKVVSTFFDEFYKSYYTNNNRLKEYLLSHANELNCTKLGYGNGLNGKGHTANGLLECFKQLEELVLRIKTISKPQDLHILVPGFAEDGMSDLITNILHEELNKFTQAQMTIHGISSNGNVKFYSWDINVKKWKFVEMPGYLHNGKEILLVPKNIVRRNFLFSTTQYFSRIIIERIRDQGELYNSDNKPIPKKDVIKSLQSSNEHWLYENAINYTEKNNDALIEYHQKLPGFYIENGGCMLDELLDKTIYQCTM